MRMKMCGRRLDTRQVRKRVDYFIGHSVGEVLVLRVCAQVRKMAAPQRRACHPFQVAPTALQSLTTARPQAARQSRIDRRVPAASRAQQVFPTSAGIAMLTVRRRAGVCVKRFAITAGALFPGKGLRARADPLQRAAETVDVGPAIEVLSHPPPVGTHVGGSSE